MAAWTRILKIVSVNLSSDPCFSILSRFVIAARVSVSADSSSNFSSSEDLRHQRFNHQLTRSFPENSNHAPKSHFLYLIALPVSIKFHNPETETPHHNTQNAFLLKLIHFVGFCFYFRQRCPAGSQINSSRMFKPIHGDDGQLIALRQRLWLSRPRLRQRRLACSVCMTRFRRRSASWRPCRRMCRCTFRAGRFRSSSPSYGGKHHNGYRIYRRFQPSWYAWPESRRKTM
jgi:hypothetical protein